MTAKTKLIKFTNLINNNSNEKFWAEGYAPALDGDSDLNGKGQYYTTWEYLEADELLDKVNDPEYKILNIGIENDTIKHKLANLVSEHNINTRINKVYFDDKLKLIIVLNLLNNQKEILINKSEFIITDKNTLHINIIRFLIECQELLHYSGVN